MVITVGKIIRKLKRKLRKSEPTPSPTTAYEARENQLLLVLGMEFTNRLESIDYLSVHH